MVRKAAERAGGCGGIRLTADGGDDRNAADGRCINVRGIGGADPADGDDRNGRSGGDGGKTIEPENGSSVLFGARCKNRTDAEVIRLGATTDELVLIRNRKPDVGFGAEDQTAVFGGEVLLTDVNARRPDGFGHVGMVVDEKRNMPGQDGQEPSGAFGDGAFLPRGRAKLNDGGAALDGRERRTDHAVGTAAQIRIKNKVERKIKRFHKPSARRSTRRRASAPLPEF